ncbi:unnamed protein product [Medioppia subpectinata]|uniref:RING-type domain-containing protein n=1 Tax=Medioppia subpectinata TaxID=1979941 RepID=A0A7R9PYG1_9ACAR|nr:unnamed protein product [Medioppia subpectinata]CAG2105876.1 unnamed protein product [Medioppia subpectinata]
MYKMVWKTFKTRIEHDKNARKLDIFRTDMNASMVMMVTDMIFQAIYRSDNMMNASAAIRTQMLANYPDTDWQCILKCYFFCITKFCGQQMPGYSSDRFPDLSAEDRDEYTCSICQEIFDCPVTTTCCLQTFCEHCINDWLQNNTTCPYDRKSLTKADLTRASRIIANTLGRFKIRCDFWDVGCREVIKLEELPHHTLNCRYKDTKCPKCQCVQRSGHDCIEALRAEIEALKLANKTVITDHDKKLGAVNARPMGQTLPQHQILADCRQHLSAPVVLYNSMSADMIDKTLALREQNSVYLVCKNVVNQMELEYGTTWHCTGDWLGGSTGYYMAEQGKYLKVKYATLTLTVFHTDRLILARLKARIEHNKISRHLNILCTDMKSSMVSVVTDIVFEAIDRADTMNNTAAVIKAQMAVRYPGITWQCFLNGQGIGGYCLTKNR